MFYFYFFPCHLPTKDARDVIRLLLMHKANPNTLWSGHSPLSLAIASGNDLVSISKYLQFLMSSSFLYAFSDSLTTQSLPFLARIMFLFSFKPMSVS